MPKRSTDKVNSLIDFDDKGNVNITPDIRENVLGWVLSSKGSFSVPVLLLGHIFQRFRVVGLKLGGGQEVLA